MLSEMTKAYSNDLIERVIKIYESGDPKKEIVNIFVTGMDTLNRWIRKYKETGSIEPCKMTKYPEKNSVTKLFVNMS